MPKEPFMLVSLKEDKAKKLAQVMSNPTCIKILEHLAGKDATESAIAKDLGLPLSTVHYNIQQLVAAKLVIVDEFHYSEKGREVNHYKLANKYIIIAPQDDDPTLLERLKKFVPITIVTIGLAAVLKVTQFFTGTLSMGAQGAELSAFSDAAIPAAAPMMKSAALPVAEQGVESVAETAADTAVGGAAPELMRAMVAPEPLNAITNETVDAAAQQIALPSDGGLGSSIQYTPQTPWWQSHAIDWFIAGALFVLAVFVIAETIAYLRHKRGKE